MATTVAGTDLLRRADHHYQRRARLARNLAAFALAMWRRGGFPEVAGVLAAGQFAAASDADEYVVATTRLLGVDTAQRQLVPRAFAGTAADGRSLRTLLEVPTRRVDALRAAGVSAAEADLAGRATLARITANEVTQAGVNAAHVATTANVHLTGYTRVLKPPSCKRCMVLAGKWFEWNTGFERHPGCDCVHLPAGDAAQVADAQTSPEGYFAALTREQQDRLLGAERAQRVRDGGDIIKALNEGRPSRARKDTAAFTVPGRRSILTDIYTEADGDREATVARLAAAGYLR